MQADEEGAWEKRVRGVRERHLQSHRGGGRGPHAGHSLLETEKGVLKLKSKRRKQDQHIHSPGGHVK